MENKKKKIIFGAILFSAFYFLFSVSAAQAASLYLSPSSGTHAIGAAFTVNVHVSSAKTMNAASGVISFPADKLEIVSLSKSGSVFSLWVQEPSFSNSSGIINFEGIVLNPGFIGSGGKIISIAFKAKQFGNAVLKFSSGSVLANDGQGTNILSELNNADFQLEYQKSAPQSTISAETSGVPLAPVIISETHPDPNKWYNNKNPKFSWKVPSGVTAVRLLYDKSSNSQPKIEYRPAISEKQIADVQDDIYYLHAQFQNAKGWGPVAHFKFQIDTVPPEKFEIKIVEGEDFVTSRPTLLFNTTDSLSGVDYYLIKIGDSDYNTLNKEGVEKNPYMLPPQPPGKRVVVVKAIDKAGNYTAEVKDIVIKGLIPPSINYYKIELSKNEPFIIRGATSPNVEVSIWLVSKNGEPERHPIQSDDNGDFAFIKSGLPEGVYDFWLTITNKEGAISESTQKYTFSINPTLLQRIGARINNILAIIIPLIALIILLLILLWYGWHKFSMLRRKIKKEVREAGSTLHKAFDLLKEDIRKQIKMLEKAKTKRELTEEEEKIIKRLTKDLNDAEKLVMKEIEDIEKEIK